MSAQTRASSRSGEAALDRPSGPKSHIAAEIAFFLNDQALAVSNAILDFREWNRNGLWHCKALVASHRAVRARA